MGRVRNSLPASARPQEDDLGEVVVHAAELLVQRRRARAILARGGAAAWPRHRVYLAALRAGVSHLALVE